MNVLFFDIDGTLVNTGGAGKDAMIEAVLSQSDGAEGNVDVLVSGRSDRGIARDLFHLNGVINNEANWQRFSEQYINGLRRNLPQRMGRVLPGVRELLESLAARKDVTLALLTGNVEQGALLKLTHFGLWDFFAFGG